MISPITNLPFFDPEHGSLAHALDLWCGANLTTGHASDVDAECRRLAKLLGSTGWLRYAVPASHGGIHTSIESRSICLIRETLAYHHGLADFVFAMQGLGSGAITLYGSERQKSDYLPGVASGEFIAAFALSEPDAGSDVAAMTTRAELQDDSAVLNGCKTWISNGGIADFYTVFARTTDGPGARGISAFLVPANTPGLHVTERLEVIAPHPLATLQFIDCRIPISAMLGEPGQGFKVAMSTLDIFRASVAAAAIGFARRAFDESLQYARARRMFGATLLDLPVTQSKFADMAAAIDSSELLTYRAAWMRDVPHANTTREAAMAKMLATENAQSVIDSAVQLFGARGVSKGNISESLYREIRALRIYEGATEVQKLIIGRSFKGSTT